MTTIFDLIGIADNLGEAEPVLNRQDAILGLIISFQVLAWACVVFRLYTRIAIIKSPWWDDLFVVLSAISTTVGAVAIGSMTGTGMGKHIVLLSAQQIERYLRSSYIANATYPCSSAFIKLALLLQYLRVFQRGSRMWMLTVALAVSTFLWGLVFGILAWFPTMPVDAYWNLAKPATRYAYGTTSAAVFVAMYEAHAAINMLLDVAVLAVAVPLFLHTDLRKNTYWGLLGLLVLGGVVNIFSIWRLQSIVETRAATVPTFDPTWYGPTPIVLSSMEVCLATVCASLPVFWPVLSKTLGPYIVVTHEIKVTRQSRHGFELGDNTAQQRKTLTTKTSSLADGKKDEGVTGYHHASVSAGQVTSFRTKCESHPQDKDMV